MLNPMIVEALGSIVRTGLAIGAGFLVNAGIWTPEDATKYVAAGALALITLAWSLYQKYASRTVLVTALAAAGPASEKTIEMRVAAGAAPSVMTSKDVVPNTSR